MSGFLDGDKTEVNKYLKLGNPPNIGDFVKATVRIVDEKPVSVFRHWINNRPYNCPGSYNGCPVCPIREAAILKSDKEGRDKYRMDRRWLINVVVLSTTDHTGAKTPTPPQEANKIYAFSKEVGQTLDRFLTEGQQANPSYDLRDIDVVIVRGRKGLRNVDITYDVEKGEKYSLPQEYAVLMDSRHDVATEALPATSEALTQALTGVTPTTNSSSGETKTSNDRDVVISKVTELAGKQGYTIEDIFPGVSVETLDMSQLEDALQLLAKA